MMCAVLCAYPTLNLLSIISNFYHFYTIVISSFILIIIYDKRKKKGLKDMK